MIRIALSGGMGTGKTYIARLLQKSGVPVFSADEEAKKLYLHSDVRHWLRTKLGTDDLKQLASLIFKDVQILRKINAKIHPMVMDLFDEWTKKQTSTMVIMESAIIFEAGIEACFDLVVVVDASMETRMKRIRQRNPNWSEQEIKDRIWKQMEQEEKCRKADIIIDNEFGSDEGITFKCK